MIQNFLDVILLVVLALFLLTGAFHGFFHSLFSLVALIVACGLGLAVMPLIGNAIQSQPEIYQTLLSYTEGSEYVKDVELSRSSIYSVDNATLDEITSDPDIPYPMGKRVREAIEQEACAEDGVTTVGDYFNLVIVRTAIHILSFFIAFCIIRILLSFVIHNVDYARGFPVLRRTDWLIGAGVGLIRGFLGLFVLFTLIPLVLIVLPVDLVRSTLENSHFVHFFYHSNVLLQLIPGI